MTDKGFRLGFGVLLLGGASLLGAASLLGVQGGARARPSAPPNYAKDIAPIIYDHCASCHRPGQVAPFPLLTYADVKKHAKLTATVTKSRYMPPWKAYGDCDFRANRSLSDAQIAAIGQWVEDGMPEGNAADLPPAPKFNDGWLLGKPDLVVTMPKAFHVPADGPDIYRNFVLPLNLPQDVYVRAIDFQPGRRSVVHHSLFFYDSTGSARKRKSDDGQPGFSGAMGTALGGGGRNLSRADLLQRVQQLQGSGKGDGTPLGSLGGWAVGAQPVELPEGLAYFVPKGADLILSTHFHPVGKAEDEQSTVGLYFAKKPPEKQFTTVQLPPLFGIFNGLDIPAGAKEYTLDDSFTLPVDVQAFGVGAHAHYLGREMTLTATLPDGTKKTLLSIPDWDFNWQDQYIFKEYVPLPKGTILRGHLVYDNSADNPRNPNSPPKRVTWGEGSTDEMGSVTVRLVAANERDLATLQQAYRAHLRDAFMSRPSNATGRER